MTMLPVSAFPAETVAVALVEAKAASSRTVGDADISPAPNSRIVRMSRRPPPPQRRWAGINIKFGSSTLKLDRF